jgi:hypothetical protein
MRRSAAIARFAIETLLFGLLAMGMLLGVIVTANQIDDEKVRYFVIGYYVAIHNGLVRWIWKKLGVEKEPPA